MSQASTINPGTRRMSARRRNATGPCRNIIATPMKGSTGPIAALFANDRTALRLARAHAARRDLTLDALARRIVEAAIKDDLVDAILDDADEIGRRS